MALFWATSRRDSVSFLRFPFHSHVQIFSCIIVPVWNIYTVVAVIVIIVVVVVVVVLLLLLIIIIIIIIFIILLLWEFFTPASADGLSMEFE